MQKTSQLLAFTCLGLLVSTSIAQETPSLMGVADPDAYKTFEEICAENGYGYEEHQITTQDGYILKLFRIPGRVNEIPKKKKVVFLQHGLFDSADTWISNYGYNSPAFQVAADGFDVWLGNSRGNKYSHTHSDKSISNADYWAFSYQEMGDFDVPASIEYVLKVTGEEKLIFVGHSQGTSQMFYGLSTNEEFFKDKVSLFIALGPITRLKNVQSTFFKVFSQHNQLILDTAKLFGIYEFFPADYLTSTTFRVFCNVLPDLCKFSLYLVFDGDMSVADTNRLGVYMSKFPAGASVYCVEHYSQSSRTGLFQMFDHGKQGNIQKYGQETAPLINLQNIQHVPIAMIVGTSDLLATKADSEWAAQQLSKVMVHYNDSYNLGHLSFMTAKDMTYFSKDVMDLIRQYSGKSGESQGFLQYQ